MADVGFVMADGYDDDFRAWFAHTTPPDGTVRLFGNNHIPASTDDVSMYAEIGFTGYSAVGLVTGNWTFNNLGGAVQQALYPTILFSGTAAGGSSIYGYYITRNSDGALWIAFRPNLAPFTFAGDWAVFVTPDIRSPG